MTVPTAVLEAAGLAQAEFVRVPWESPVWLFETTNGRGLLKVLSFRSELKREMDLLRALRD